MIVLSLSSCMSLIFMKAYMKFMSLEMIRAPQFLISTVDNNMAGTQKLCVGSKPSAK
jgi:hypothetical protein